MVRVLNNTNREFKIIPSLLIFFHILFSGKTMNFNKKYFKITTDINLNLLLHYNNFKINI